MTDLSSTGDMWLTDADAFEFVKDNTEECPDAGVVIESMDLEGSFDRVLISRYVPDENFPYKPQYNSNEDDDNEAHDDSDDDFAIAQPL